MVIKNWKSQIKSFTSYLNSPRGNGSPQRPSEQYVIPLRDLKDELGIPRNQDLESDDLHKFLEKLVLDEKQDALALKVFGLIFYSKFICPGYHPRIKKEATMVVDFDLVKLKDMQLCQIGRASCRERVYVLV